MGLIETIVRAGFSAVADYLSYHVLTCLVPAFFIAGAVGVFVSRESVLRYFGPKANRVLSYGVASVSGTVLAVCSCTILPLFAGIWMSGAGLGPAIAFLYSGPAINILAITYSARLLGIDIGIGRAAGAVFFSVAIGLAMAFLFKEENKRRATKEESRIAMPDSEDGKSPVVYLLFFSALVGILIFGASKKVYPTGFSFLLLGGVVLRHFSAVELREWMRETWDLAVKIFPLLLVGVFVAGVMREIIPPESVARLVGNDGFGSSLVSSVAGALFYFSTLTEVPIIRALMDMGMAKGPALSLLLSGPALSLPSIVVLSRILGLKKTMAYTCLVVIFSTIAGVLFGMFF